jgi:hypothetical protein
LLPNHEAFVSKICEDIMKTGKEFGKLID